MRKKGRRAPGRSGYTLIEVVVAMGLFSLAMMLLSGTLASFFTSYRSARELQRNVEQAQFAINLMAKELRTSTIVEINVGAPYGPRSSASAASPDQPSQIQMWDYSQEKCIVYRIDDADFGGGATHTIQRDVRLGATDFSDCEAANSVALANPVTMTSGYVGGGFYVVHSRPPAGARVGFVTINLQVKNSATAGEEVALQTTVSSRDYEYSQILAVP